MEARTTGPAMTDTTEPNGDRDRPLGVLEQRLRAGQPDLPRGLRGLKGHDVMQYHEIRIMAARARKRSMARPPIRRPGHPSWTSTRPMPSSRSRWPRSAVQPGVHGRRARWVTLS